MSLSPIIEIEELLLIYKNPEVLIFDASNGNNAKANYEQEHLEGAYFIDLNTQLASIPNDFSNGGRHPLPDINTFAETLTQLGISKESHLIIYDDKNASNAAARFWWMLKSAGHQKVQVLNGGITNAREKHFPMSSKKETPRSANKRYDINHWNLPTIDMNELEKVNQNPNYLVVDVRDKYRYDGIAEPIDLIAGHIPGAINIPFTENVDPKGLFLTPGELKQQYENKIGAFSPDHIIVHCGSGVTACHTLLAMNYAGLPIPMLYVGSWSEWSRNNKPIETNT